MKGKDMSLPPLKCLTLLLVLIALCTSMGCTTMDGHWTLYLTRKTVPQYYKSLFTGGGSGSSISAPGEIAILFVGVVLVVIPTVMIAMDLLFLPFAIAHDIWLETRRSPLLVPLTGTRGVSSPSIAPARGR
ncbi:MAG: hypothetical protein ACYTHN_21460 [Planctomycetota bacterium]|jgi:hypothetical protein